MNRFRSSIEPLRVPGILLITALTLMLIGPASAQELRRGETVTDRVRPDYDAVGRRLGRFDFYPSLDFRMVNDDNIFADDDLKRDDWIAVVTPEVLLVSEWNRAELELGTNLEVGRYSDFDNEDYEDWRIWTEGATELGRGQVTGELRYEDLRELRTSADDQRGIEPTTYSVGIWNAGYRGPFGDFDFRADLGQRLLEFDDTITLTGPESNRDRDRTETRFRGRVGYSLSARFQPFVRVGITDINYDQQPNDEGFFRSSFGWDVVGGTAIDLSGKTFGEVFVGYIEREYDDTRFVTIDGPIFGAELTWNITGLTTAQFSASRLIKATTITGASGILDTGVGFRIDHELLRNLILSLDTTYNEQDFEGIDRTDDIFGLQLEGVYLLNRYVHLLLGYDILNRDTSPEDSGGRVFDRQRIYLGVRGQI